MTNFSPYSSARPSMKVLMSRESQIAAKRSRAEYPLDVPLLEHLHRCDRRLGFEERKRMMRDESLRGSPSRDGHRQRCKHHDIWDRDWISPIGTAAVRTVPSCSANGLARTSGA